MSKKSVSFLIEAVAFLVTITPKKILWFKASVWAFLWFDVFRFRRYTVLRGISIAFPHLEKAQRYALARRSLRHQCYLVFELLALPRLTTQTVEKTMQFHGLENYEKAKAQGRGVLMLALHIANGDLGVSAMAHRSIPVHLITRKAKSEMANHIWFQLRQRHGVQLIDAQGLRSAQEILQAAQKNECVIFVLDQYIPSPYGVNVPFFGRKTGTGLSLAKFALKLNAPVIPVWTYRDADLNTHIVFDPEIPGPQEPVAKSDQEAMIERMTLKYNLALEEIIRKYPEQWMWVHRRWKRFR